MKIAMPAVTDAEIADGYRFHHQNLVLVAYETPDDDGHACGYDTVSGKDYDLWFVWTSVDCWVFVNASKAEHEA
jgi:hypothetical protein